MREWIIENIDLICIVSALVIFFSIISAMVTAKLAKSKAKKLKKKIRSANSTLRKFCGIDFSGIKDGTRKEVLAQMRTIISKKLREESFSTPCGRFCEGEKCNNIHTIP